MSLPWMSSQTGAELFLQNSVHAQHLEVALHTACVRRSIWMDGQADCYMQCRQGTSEPEPLGLPWSYRGQDCQEERMRLC